MKKEKGAAAIIEYTIVLPVVLAIVLTLIFVGFAMHQKAVMESATHRAAIYISRTMTDPSYENIVTTDASRDTNDILSAQITRDSIVNAPYRYLFAGRDSVPDTEFKIAELIARNQLFTDTSPNVSITKQGGIFPKVIVTATQDYQFPTLLSGLNLPSIFTIETESIMYVNQPAEFIRNADYITDIIIDVTGPIVEKITSVVSKIEFFKKNVK